MPRLWEKRDAPRRGKKKNGGIAFGGAVGEEMEAYPTGAKRATLRLIDKKKGHL